MKKTLKKLIAFWLVLAVGLTCSATLLACSQNDNGKASTISVLFTSDVHGATLNDTLGYSAVLASKRTLEKNGNQVTLVDLGDATQGNDLANYTKGKSAIDLMNRTGYDYAVLGNHEFDYGMDAVDGFLRNSNAQYLGCNIKYSGSKTNAISLLKPFAIEHYDKYSVAFIGVTSPTAISESVPIRFMENGVYVYDFNANSLASCVQQSVDQCIELGADYVVILSHLGEAEQTLYNSRELIRAIKGVDVVLDGHSHSTIESEIIKDKENNDVVLSSVGKGLNAIGHLSIKENGEISVEHYVDCKNVDQNLKAYIENQEASLQTVYSEKVFQENTVAMSMVDEQGVRKIRDRETTLGNFVADAFRIVGDADIGLINGGGIRASLPAGDITKGDLLKVHSYYNNLCVVQATGQQIADALELSNYLVSLNPDAQNDQKYPDDEWGGFLSVSGLKFTVDTSVATPVTFDAQDLFSGITAGQQRRVKDIQVLNKSDNTYSALDMNKTYKVASIDYILILLGNGYNMFDKDKVVKLQNEMHDYEVLNAYLQTLTPEKIAQLYSSVQGRITLA